ncbi:hypothetical protein C8A05DRAFT_12086 [Staphylotrichum tortipilum]|uniref:Uncharacterized protein n=1 Tax=Staphylotrichum tortipilum TaxID=2831512 RepID=A0AAN6MSJ6_9PEZI|nr:hypothetical protein C8A05DRAFT_12086 [Staphylotrichum longicolle]
MFTSVVFTAVIAITGVFGTVVNAAPTGHEGDGAAVAIRQSQVACSDGATVEKLWLVERLNVTYTENELVRHGNASWTIVNTLAKTTEHLSCALRANYICELNGTPGDPSLHIWVQINLDVATFSINQTITCGSEPTSRPASAIGTADLYLICPRIDQDLSCYGDDDGGGYADGVVTLPTISL